VDAGTSSETGISSIAVICSNYGLGVKAGIGLDSGTDLDAGIWVNNSSENLTKTMNTVRIDITFALVTIFA
jgi:hypothetical protein